MNILLRSDGGPIEGFRSAAFRVAISDEGFGEIVALPEDLENVGGVVVASVDGVDVFAWRIEDRDAVAGDVETVTVTGRGRVGSLERAVVLPVGYPNFTSRTRAEQGPPFAVWADLLVEAQGRGRAVGLTPTWTASEDSQGQPWQEVVDFELEPGVTLADLLREVAEVEGAEWIIRPDGSIDAARGLGVDRSSEVVLFVGHNQISRGRRESSRNQRQTVFLEASTGVSEITNEYTDADAGEIWVEGQDFRDPLSRELVAEKLASKLAEPEIEVEVAVDPECGVFERFDVGDVIGLDTGRDGIEPVRVIGATVSVNEEGVEVELTLVSQVALRQQQIDRAIEAKADVKLAAGATLQRRHGLVTADKFLSGAVGDDVAISSENYIPGVQGWVITGDGDVEFNDGTFRGDLQSDNYVAGVAGWTLLRTGFAEFEEGLFRGDIVGGTISIGTNAFNVDESGRVFAGSGDFATAPLTIDSDGSLNAAGVTITGGTVRTGATGQRVEMRSVGSFGFPSIEFYDTDNLPLVRMTSVLGDQLQFAIGDGKRITMLGNGGLFQIRNDGRIEFQGSNIGGVSQVYMNPNTGTLSLAGNLFASLVRGSTLTSTGGINASGTISTSGSISASGTISTSGSISAGSTLSAGSTATLNGDTTFRNTQSGRRFTMNQAGSGSQGGEPTLDTSGDLFGFVGIPSRRMFRGYAGAWLTSSEGRLKGEVEDADLGRCYQAVREMRLTNYALNRDRDDYYTAKGEHLLGERDEFVDRGGPLRKLGLIAEEAPDEVADEEHQNIDLYSYASLVVGAVKALQAKVEAIEDQIAGG